MKFMGKAVARLPRASGPPRLNERAETRLARRPGRASWQWPSAN